MIEYRHSALMALALVCACLLPSAEVRLASYFGDNMVLQRNSPIRIWGWADPGSAIQVSLGAVHASARVDATGAWLAILPALTRGDNLELTITGAGTITLRNLVVGDVWLCSGQSNMDLPVNGLDAWDTDIKPSDFPKIRCLKVKNTRGKQIEKDITTEKGWLVCTPTREGVGQFTGAGFHFAREIQARTGIPIGIVHDAWGGTRIEAWMPPAALDLVPSLRVQAVKPAPSSTEPEWGLIANAMICPLSRCPFAGVLWYQGESNADAGDTADLYADKLQALVLGWRRLFENDNLPFYIVQLTSYKKPTDNPAECGPWAPIREAQLRALSIPKTGLAVTIDIGEEDNIHPRNKYDVGLRLARWALASEYGQKQEVSGPLYRDMHVEGGKIRIAFTHAESGLMIGKKDRRKPVQEEASGTIHGFAIAGADKLWTWAEASIDGQTIVVTSPRVPKPVAVRYAYSQNPGGANVYNRDGLPASPFRSDRW